MRPSLALLCFSLLTPTSTRRRPSAHRTDQEGEKRAPITVKFEIPYFTVSGIQVRYLKIVEKSGYQALPWVRYITQNGDDYRCVSVCREEKRCS